MSSKAEVAIVGYAARLPGARNTGAFWSLLRDNRCSIGAITNERFPTEAFFHPSPDQPGKSYTFAAGLIDDVWGFDAGAFGMSPREAEQVDPQQRHLLEVTHDALAHAGIRPSALAGSHTGVYVGASSVDYGARFFADPSAADVHMMTGNTLSIISNRLSYNFNLHGPSFTVDTACSSSMVALSLAVDAIQQGTVDTAIVAGANLLLSPFSFVGFSRASMLSPTGLCRPFDAAADGYVRSEGVIVLVLRSMAAARQGRNRVHAAILGAAIGQDGRTTGLSLPSADAQRTILEQVYSNTGVAAEDLSFVEAHGTGTRVGDPIEADALGKALGQKRVQPLPIGSVKSNIGHLEPASGLAGVLKTVLALNKGLVPATLHQSVPNSDIPFDDLNLRVLSRAWRLPERRAPHLAGVNSFGFGGTNAHVILRSDDAVVSVLGGRKGASDSPLLLTAHSDKALGEVAAAFVEQWPQDPKLVPDFVGAAAHQRDRLPNRAILRTASAEALRQEVDRFARGEASPNVMTGQALGNDLPVAFVFSGNGSQWAGMGRAAWQADGRFRDALTEVDSHFAKKADWSLVKTLFADDLGPQLRRATYAQPLIFALQVATVRVLVDSGLSPQAVLGHSVGEIAAAWAAGCLGLDQALDVVIARSRHQEQTRGSGGMAALMLGERDARRVIESARVSAVTVAAVNSWRSVTLSGPSDEIDRVVAAAAELRVSARRLDLDYPFHSTLVEPVRGPLMRELAGLKPRQSRRAFISSTTGTPLQGPELVADHWWHNVRDPVQFDAGLKCLLKDGFRVFVEIGPKPILGSYIRDILREAEIRGTSIESLTETAEAEAMAQLERTVSRVALAGGRVDSTRFFGPPPAVAVPLPAYPWRHTQFKVRPTVEATTIFETVRHPLLGARPHHDSQEWFSTIDPALFPWLADHKVGGIPVFPAAAYVEALLAVAREIHPGIAIELREMDIVRPLVFDGHTSFETLLRLSRETGVTEFLSRPRGGGLDWALNARAIVARAPANYEHLASEAAPAGKVFVPKAKVYEIARDLGFEYGPSFQRIHHVSFPEPKRAVAALEAGSALLPDAVIDFTALDAAFHALFASEEAGVADMPMKQMLPMRFARVRVFAPGRLATQAVARTVRQSLTSIVADIELRDDAGEIVVLAETVRLIEAPVAAAADPRALAYRSTTWRHDRVGKVSKLGLPAAEDAGPDPLSATEAERLGEALLLLEAGCLRAVWSAFADDRALGAVRDNPPAAEGDSEWPAYLCSALLWHLETKNLIKEQQGSLTLAESCPLPAVESVVRSLLSRHPTMAAEAASLSRLSGIMGRLVAGDSSVHAELNSSHWRQLNVASGQVSLLRRTVARQVMRALDGRDKTRLVRLLLVGADHAIDMAEQLEALAGVDVVITDLDADRLEQAGAALGDDAPHIRCVPWGELASWPAGTFDMAAAIDALSEIAAVGGGLDRLHRLLRPGAPIVAGEPAPSLFWDIVRGIRGTWWARSANSEFPVGALLTTREWIDELANAGFSQVAGQAFLGDEGIGVVVRGRADPARALEGSYADPPAFAWEGDTTENSRLLRPLVAGSEAGGPREETTGPANRLNPSDVVWTIDAKGRQAGSRFALEDHLDRLGERCRRLAAAPGRLWVLVDFGRPQAVSECAAHPLWRALTAALRVTQNEYPHIDVRCLGIAATPESGALEGAAEEMLAPTDEHELLFLGGERVVVRIERGVSQPQVRSRSADEPNLKLTSRSGTNRGGLTWKGAPRQSPGPGEVEIEVAATGLNFRDVMWNLGMLPEEALEDGYAGAALGMECAGVVTTVGEDVQGLQAGDRVVAFVSGGFANHVVAPAFAVSPIPGGLTLEAAATLPVAFLTAYYSLVHLACLKRGETVLIHGGAGAVGLAALQVARYCGARVVATAGTEEKRALLRDLGADTVLNSRTLAFADEVLAHSNGRGVDVVLNSLAGEAMVRSMDCLRPFGRFIELGKRDFYANTHLGLRPLRRNLTYFGVDVDQLIVEHRELTQQLFQELLELFASGEFTPLPYRVFSGDRISNAFRLMQRAGHIGKIVVTPASRPTDMVRPNGAFPVDPEATHVVIGGTSGFGLATAGWLAGRGARHLTLVSRSGVVSDAARPQLEALRRSDVAVDLASLDIADPHATEAFLMRLQAERRVAGVVHAAMVLDDRLIESMDREAIGKVLDPKVGGALALEAAAGGLSLDYLLFYSSATTLLGNPGQYNYVAANAFMEGVAQRARRNGLPAVAVSWGGIEDAGYLARNIGTNAALKKRFSSSLLAARSALDALDLAFDSEGRPVTAALAIAQIDWGMAKRELAVIRTPLFAAVAPAAGTRPAADASATLEKLREMSPADATAALLDIIVDEIAQVLRLPAKEVDRHRPLAEIGMDSLMMLELRATVETALHVELPMMSLANGITPADVARRIAPIVLGEGGPQEGVAGNLMALSTSHLATDTAASTTGEQLAAARAVLARSRTMDGPL